MTLEEKLYEDKRLSQKFTIERVSLWTRSSVGHYGVQSVILTFESIETNLFERHHNNNYYYYYYRSKLLMCASPRCLMLYNHF